MRISFTSMIPQQQPALPMSLNAATRAMMAGPNAIQNQTAMIQLSSPILVRSTPQDSAMSRSNSERGSGQIVYSSSSSSVRSR